MARRYPKDLIGLAEAFRELRNDYDAAKSSRFKRKRTGYVSTGSTADYHYRTEAAYFGIMESARDLFRNHALVAQGVRRLVANVIRGGYNLDTKTGDEGVDRELSARWKAWSEDPDQCDLAGERNWHAIERLTLQQAVTDGDIFSLPTTDGPLQLVEAHRVRTPRSTTRNVIHGVLLDEFRRRQEYWITNDDIDPTATVSTVSQVTRRPARDNLGHRAVFHHYFPDRASQTRGLTALVPVTDTAGMGDDLFFAQLVKAQMAACVVLLRELDANAAPAMPIGQDLSTETRPDGSTRTIAGFGPGMEVFSYAGEKLTGFSPNIPNAEFFQHALLILTIVAVNLDLPVAVFLLDPSNTNFSGWRGAIDQARQRFQSLQRDHIASLHRPVYRWKVRQWIAEDAILRQAFERLGDAIFNHLWHPEAWPYIEPVKDAMGDVLEDRNLRNSPRRLAARRGIDYEDLVEEICEDRARMIRRGHDTAQRLNQELGLDDKLTWRDIVAWPMPEGISMKLPIEEGASDASQPA